MLPRNNRLNLKVDFKWVSSGKRLEAVWAKLFFRLGQVKNPRVGIATSSKVFKRAVDRNRARRLLSKGFENLYDNLIEGVNIVALPKDKILSMTAVELEKELKDILDKNNLLKI